MYLAAPSMGSLKRLPNMSRQQTRAEQPLDDVHAAGDAVVSDEESVHLFQSQAYHQAAGSSFAVMSCQPSVSNAQPMQHAWKNIVWQNTSHTYV